MDWTNFTGLTQQPKPTLNDSFHNTLPFIIKYGKENNVLSSTGINNSLYSQLGGFNSLGLGYLDNQQALQDATKWLSHFGVNNLSDLGYRSALDSEQNPGYEVYNKLTGEGLPTGFGITDLGGDSSLQYFFNLGKDGSVGLDSRVATGNADFTWTDLLPVLAVVAAPFVAGALGAGGAATGATEAGTLGGAGAGGGFGGGAALSAEAGATGLSTLPTAGTWAQTALPTLGASAGQWTLPAALSGVSGATATAGGLTLADGLSNANTMGDLLGTFGTSSGGGSSNSLFDMLSEAYKNSPNLPNLGGSNSNQQQQQQGSGNMLSNMNANSLLGFLGSLYAANDDSLSNQLTDIANKALERGDPFGDQRTYYEGLLKNTYNDPAGTYDQYKAQDQTFFNQLAAQNAARGRSTDAYKTGVEREAAYNNWLTGYRGQLGGFAGANIDPSRMAGEYMTGLSNVAMMNNYNQMAPWRAGANLFNNPNGSSMSLGDIYNTGKDLYNTGSDLWNWGSSFF